MRSFRPGHRPFGRSLQARDGSEADARAGGGGGGGTGGGNARAPKDRDAPRDVRDQAPKSSAPPLSPSSQSPRVLGRLASLRASLGGRQREARDARSLSRVTELSELEHPTPSPSPSLPLHPRSGAGERLNSCAVGAARLLCEREQSLSGPKCRPAAALCRSSEVGEGALSASRDWSSRNLPSITVTTKHSSGGDKRGSENDDSDSLQGRGRGHHSAPNSPKQPSQPSISAASSSGSLAAADSSTSSLETIRLDEMHLTPLPYYNRLAYPSSGSVGGSASTLTSVSISAASLLSGSSTGNLSCSSSVSSILKKGRSSSVGGGGGGSSSSTDGNDGDGSRRQRRRSVQFGEKVVRSEHEVPGVEDYERAAPRTPITQADAYLIREELTKYKLYEMITHPQSAHNTHFYDNA